MVKRFIWKKLKPLVEELIRAICKDYNLHVVMELDTTKQYMFFVPNEDFATDLVKALKDLDLPPTIVVPSNQVTVYEIGKKSAKNLDS